MGKTVSTYLIDGDPKGTQKNFIPRSNLRLLVEDGVFCNTQP